MRWTVVPLSLVFPGVGHTALGMPVRGFAYTALFAVGALTTIGFGFTAEEPFMDLGFVLSLWASGLVYVLCQFALLCVLIRAARSANMPEKDERLRAGMAAAARGADSEAETELRRVLAMDPTDVEAHLNLGALYARLGRRSRARRHLKSCRRFDILGKWDWEVDWELEALRGPLQM